MPQRSSPPVHTTPGRPTSRWRAMLRDIQFWIPLGVLVAGLLLLRWVA
jgi:phenylalanyl-tRNA synthetase beta subunit